MKKIRVSNVYSLIVLGLLLLFAATTEAKPEFPSNAYQRLERSALSNGYGDVASSMALLFRYRETLDRCDNPENQISAYAFAEFLDSFITTVNQYMNMSGIWRPAVRQNAENYVANASVLIQVYLEKKIAKFGEDSLDKEMLEMLPKMHMRLAKLLMVGGTSETSLKNKWRTTQFDKFLADRNWGKIARSMGLLDRETSPVCPKP